MRTRLREGSPDTEDREDNYRQQVLASSLHAAHQLGRRGSQRVTTGRAPACTDGKHFCWSDSIFEVSGGGGVAPKIVADATPTQDSAGAARLHVSLTPLPGGHGQRREDRER